MMHFGHGYDYGFELVRMGMMGMMLIFIVAVVVLLLIIIRHKTMKNHFNHYNHFNEKPSLSNSKAMEILNEKLALGEITEEEYTRKKELING